MREIHLGLSDLIIFYIIVYIYCITIFFNDESFYVGNILKDDFSNIWEYNFEDFRKRKWVEKTVCNSCEHVKDCNGGSIHLWNLGDEKPKFCYAKEII